jgi:hypothetical protein
LVLGKGPTYDAYLSLPDDHGYQVLGLNNTCLPRPVFAALVLDCHNVEPLAERLLSKEPCARYLILPWYLHEANKPSRHNLEHFTAVTPVLAELRQQGRLVVFNSSLSDRQPRGPGPRVPVRYFSVTAAVGLLAVLGAREIWTLGVDGGSRYSPLFDGKNLFLNGRQSFDIQFRQLDAVCRRYKVRLAPLGLTDRA